jgi:hypothetical protein
MVLQRILIVVLILFVVWRLLAMWGRRMRGAQPGADSYSRFNPQQRRQRREQFRQPPEALVSCDVCGTMIPVGRALTAIGGGRVCGDECRARLDRGEA